MKPFASFSFFKTSHFLPKMPYFFKNNWRQPYSPSPMVALNLQEFKIRVPLLNDVILPLG